MDLQLAHRVPVADYETVEVPLVTKHLTQQKLIARSRHTIEIAERCHERSYAGIDGSLERLKVNIA